MARPVSDTPEPPAGYVNLEDWRARHGEGGARRGNGQDGDTDRRCAWFRCEDVGNAERFIARHGENVRHAATLGWLVWDGRRWAHDETYRVIDLAKETARAIYAESAAVAAAGHDDRAKHLATWAHKSCSSARIDAMLSLSRPAVAERHTAFDRDHALFNVLNGTLNLRTGALREHRRGDLITRLAPVPFDRDAACPEFDAFLASVFPDNSDLIDYLQRFFGYSLTGEVREQCLVFLYGHGANGKSTLLSTMRAVLGDYGAQAGSALLLQSERHNAATGLARLRGARFVATTEVAEGRRLAEELVKQITGGEPVTARFLYRDEFEFTPTFKLWLAANNRPVVREMDHAMWRRIKLIPFDVTFYDQGEGNPEKDPELPARLLDELPGILAWAVRGAIDWYASGLQEPATVRAATKEYRDEMDTVGAFISEALLKGKPSECNESSRDLYAAYTRFCEERGERASSQRRLGDRLRESGFEKGSDEKGKLWRGLMIKASFRV